jgi:hypothetical protein
MDRLSFDLLELHCPSVETLTALRDGQDFSGKMFEALSGAFVTSMFLGAASHSKKLHAICLANTLEFAKSWN